MKTMLLFKELTEMFNVQGDGRTFLTKINARPTHIFSLSQDEAARAHNVEI